MDFSGINDDLVNVLNTNPDSITILVIVVCGVLFLLSFVISRLRDIAPALMVSAGIIGTFWGTFIALQHFSIPTGEESGKLVDSIPFVLNGMKSAFVTSLIGLGSGFVAKIIFRFLPEPEPKIGNQMLPNERLIAGLLGQIKDGIIGEGDKSLSSQISILQSQYRDSADVLKQAISGESESSIASQLIKLRNENVDGFKSVDNKLDALENVNSLGFNTISARLEEVKSENNEGFNTLNSQLNELKSENHSDFSLLNDKFTSLENVNSLGFNTISARLEEVKSENNEGFNTLNSQLNELKSENHSDFNLLNDKFLSLENVNSLGFNTISARLEEVKSENNEGFNTLDSRLNELKSENHSDFNLLNDKFLSLENVNIAGFNKLDTQLENVKSGNSEGFNALDRRIDELKNENITWFKVLDSRLEGLADTINNSLVKAIEKLIVDLRDIIVNELVEQLQQTNELLRTQLTDMIARIEKALIEQFGKTFKEFNEATQAIKKWQEDHRVQVEQLTHAFETTATGIEKIRADCESIPATMDSLRNLMGELNERLKAFADMKKSAEESFPVIKKHLDTVGEDLKNSAEGFSGLEKTIQTIIAENHNASQQHQDSISGIVIAVQEATGSCVTEITNTLDKALEQWGKHMVGISEEMAKAIKSQQ